MLCQNCGENDANVKYTQIINGVKKQMNLCDKCAKQMGIDNISINIPIDFSNFLIDPFEENSDMVSNFFIDEKTVCDKCGSSYEDFIKNGKFGCDKCYESFENKIDELLKNIQGTNKHVGKRPKLIEDKENIGESEIVKNREKNKQTDSNHSLKEEINKKENIIEKLKLRLRKEIEEERYEDAAKTRDEIKKITD